MPYGVYFLCMKTIHNLREKIKSFLRSAKGRDLVTILIIVFVAIGSFLLGSLSGQERAGNAPIVFADSLAPYKLDHAIDTAPKQTSQITTSPSKTGAFMASKNGTKYYPDGCSNRILDENKVFFNTTAEAESAGYTLSSTCK